MPVLDFLALPALLLHISSAGCAPVLAPAECQVISPRDVLGSFRGGIGLDEPSAKIEDTSPGTSMIELSRNHCDSEQGSQ